MSQRMVARCVTKAKSDKEFPMFYYIDMVEGHESFGVGSVVKVFAKEIGIYFAEVKEIIPFGTIMWQDISIGLAVGIIANGYLYEKKR